MASVTAALTGYFVDSESIGWGTDVSFGSVFNVGNQDQVLSLMALWYDGQVQMTFTGFAKEFTPEFEATGRIIIEASDGEILEVMIANADMAEPYLWTPANSAEVIVFAAHVQALSDQDASLTLTDEPAPPTTAAPSFTDDTGDAQNWTQNTAISPITVPEADGNPTPTYAAVGSLPAGLAFDTSTRVISGTPTSTGSGTIRVRATNSEGDDDWTVRYTTLAALAAPSFADDTGDAQAWTQGTAITPITVPEADGNPSPSYAVVGSLPAGISFNTGTRLISGTPTAVGSGTIRIRATNSEGHDDWSVTYTTTAQAEPSATIVFATVSLDISEVRLTQFGAGGLIPPEFVEGGGSAYVRFAFLRLVGSGYVAFHTVVNVSDAGASSAGPNLVSGWESNPTALTFSAPGLADLVVPGPTAPGSTPQDTEEPYSWVPSNGSDVLTWAASLTVSHVVSVTLSLLATPPPVAPNFVDDTGDAQNWTAGVAITPITVPAADGNPTPSYAAVGSLPNGISFNTNTRVISGTPTSTGSGTIRVRATNSEGDDDWTVRYTTTAALAAPSFIQGTADWTFAYTIMVATGAATAQPIPTILLEVDWAGDGSFSHADSDITADLVGDLEFSRGRGSYGSQLYGRSVAGILTCTLRNSSRQYDQLSVQSSIGSLLTSQRRVRVSLEYDGVSPEVEWSGYLDTVEPAEKRGGRDTVKVQALGLLALLQEASPPVASGIDEGIGSILGRIVDAVVSGLDNSLLASTRQIANWVRNPRQTSLESSRELEETEGGFLKETRDGRLALEGRDARATGSRVPIMTLVDRGVGDAVAEKMQPILRAQDIANTVRVQVRNSSNDTTKVLWSTDQSISIAGGSFVRVIAEYPTPSAPSNHAGVHDWETLQGGTDYDPVTGLTVTQTAEGNQLVINLANSNAADIDVARLQARGQALILHDPIGVEYSNQSSIDTYLPRDYKTPAQWLGSVADAADYARAILATHAQPRRRLRTRWFGNDSSALALSVDLSDRVRVVERDTAILYYVEFIKHRISAGKVHLVEYILSPPSLADVTFIFDTSEFDSGVLGF